MTARLTMGHTRERRGCNGMGLVAARLGAEGVGRAVSVFTFGLGVAGDGVGGCLGAGGGGTAACGCDGPLACVDA
jgi:hypothetical protein